MDHTTYKVTYKVTVHFDNEDSFKACVETGDSNDLKYAIKDELSTYGCVKLEIETQSIHPTENKPKYSYYTMDKVANGCTTETEDFVW